MEQEKCYLHVDLERRVAKIEDRMSAYEERLNEVEESSIRREEQIKTIFKVLDDINLKIGEILDDIKSIQLRPTRYFDGAVMAMISSLIGAAITYLVMRK